MFLAIFVIVQPVSAQIADGTYELDYEMKEAHSENTSIADGYFTKPATLTVQNGVQYIQMTVTGSNYIESLSAPTGPVETLSEDTEKHIRVVKFKVEADLSKPLDMEMRIIVPDLYDMTHTARAVFDLSGVQNKSESIEEKNVNKDTSKTESSKSEEQKNDVVESNKKEEESKQDEQANEDTKSETAASESEDVAAEENADSEEEVEEENAESTEDEIEEDIQVEEETEETTNAANETTDDAEEKSSSLWIVFVVIAVVVIGIVLWILRKKAK